MKNITVAILLAVGISSGSALADSQTFSLGFAQSKVKDFKSIRGFNVQYRYEIDAPISLLTSFTWMKRDNSSIGYLSQDLISRQLDVNYFSLMTGPAYRINDYISLYTLGGASRTKTNGSYTWVNAGDNYTETGSLDSKSTNFTWGAGIIINPVPSLSFTAGYESSKAKLSGDRSINGFNVGLGYRF